jgi:geranylgeranyl diphosphate synthase type II
MKPPAVLTESASRVEIALRKRLAGFECGSAKQRLLDAMRYSTLNGGKRIRAALVYAAAHSTANTLPAHAIDDLACAVEMIHAYSLIHDDLPAMDNDDYRRGQPTCHVKSGESVAILAGDTLQIYAFELLSNSNDIPDKRRLAIINILAKSIGVEGMAGGQAMDMLARESEMDVSIPYVEETHLSKTGALFRASVMIGVNELTSTHCLAALEKFALLIGLGFQIQDDLLDWCDPTKENALHSEQKASYPAVVGLQGARKHLQAIQKQAPKILESFPEMRMLKEIGRYMVEREQ